MENKKLVLVADDYDDAAEITAELLAASTEYETVSVKDGQEALDLAVKCRPDACVLDIDMPRINGIEVASRLRSIYRHTPPLLIAVSGGSVQQAEDSAQFDHVLRKPVKIAELIGFLNEM